MITDRATYAYLADLFVDPAHRRRGLGKFLVTYTLAHPQLQGLRRRALATADAHGLYRQFGFTPAQQPHIHMFIERPAAELWPAGSELKAQSAFGLWAACVGGGLIGRGK